MLSAIIATHESEHALVPTLAALVPGVTAGLLGQVIVSDAGSRDATAEIAEIAGCQLMTSDAPLGARLRAAAAATQAPWLIFLRAGCVPEPSWVEAAERFIDASAERDGASAAVFRPPGFANLLRPGLAELIELARVALGGGAKPEQGLLIARMHYDRIGGHPDTADAEAAMLRRIGRRRLTMLSSSARFGGRPLSQ